MKPLFTHKSLVVNFLIIILAMSSTIHLRAQDQITLQTDPDPIRLMAGESLDIKVKAIDKDGKILPEGKLFFVTLRETGLVPTSGMKVDSIGHIDAYQAGVYNLVIYRVAGNGKGFTRKYAKVTVTSRPVAKVEINNFQGNLYEGMTTVVDGKAYDDKGNEVKDATITMTSSNKNLMTVTGNTVRALKAGNVELTAAANDIKTVVKIKVAKNPIARVSLALSKDEARTGDVIQLKAQAWDKNGKQIQDVPFEFAYAANLNTTTGGGAGVIDQEGRFVAEKPGAYTIMASTGDRVAKATLTINPRFVSREIKLTGKGIVSSKHTSDFWVWEGTDGKDYAVTGTWGADGTAYFWDVTNPSDLLLIDSVKVDARTVNDVKVSEDGKLCIISREGASNRKNGIVIIDVSNPRSPEIISTYTENLTGGVHNLFIYKDHVYALSNGQRYDIINIKDPKKPYRVSKFELSGEARAIHDVWIEDGIAYSSNWNDGVVMVDVGNGKAGGSPANPVEIGRARVEGDANHAAFPFKSKTTDKFYIIAGDEIFPLVFMENSEALIAPSGYLHFMDFTDPDNPKEVARYEVPGAGSHNFWVEDDLLYIGYYNGGVRVVDISGDLMGDLYRQGREVAHYLPMDADAYTPNAPMVWGAQPYKGHIFMSDFNSGLWSVKLSGELPSATNLNTK